MGRMLFRNDEMLLRIAQADAFAAAVEYVDQQRHPELLAAVRRFDAYHQHPTHRKLRPGMYTDDAQMSIAVAEVLLREAGAQLDGWGTILTTPYVWYDAFYSAFHRDPRDGYSRGFQELLESCRTPAELQARLVPDSNKNGAAMRSVPLGVLPDPMQVVLAAATQANTTHDTTGGREAAIAVALMSHFSLYDPRGFSDVLGWGVQHCPAFEYFRVPWSGPVTGGWKTKDSTGLGVGLNTAWAVHTLLSRETTLRGIMDRLIGWGGDTDSVAAIAWGIASARCQGEALPEFLERDLESRGNLRYGPAFLRDLGTRLMSAYAG